MAFYENTHYIFPDGHMEQITIVPIVTNVLRKYGLPSRINEPVKVKGITIYPWDYFCPIEFMSSKMEISDNTHTIHHYSASWMSKNERLLMWRGYFFRTNPIGKWLKKIIRTKM